MKKIIAAIVFALLLGLAGYFFYYNYNYSDGVRTGYLMKISKKGMLFKTFEGQLNMGGVGDGEMNTIIQNNIWEFSVANEATYKELQEMEGKQIKVHYKEKVGSFFWQGDTNYFVDDVDVVE